MMLKIIVASAHFTTRICFERAAALPALWSARDCLSKPSIMVEALNVLLRKKNALYGDEKGVMVYENIFGSVYPQCTNEKNALYGDEKGVMVCENIFDPVYPQCTNEDRSVLRACLVKAKGSVLRDVRSEVTLNVEPCMKVGALKSLLKAKPWIPMEDLVLIGVSKFEDGSPTTGARLLEDDSSTLNDCGIEDEDTLLACMDGSFQFTVVDMDQEPNKEFVIPISSCFETVGELKSRIHQKTGKAPDDQHLLYQFKFIGTNDISNLFSWGISRPYLNMPESSNVIKILPESIFRKLTEP